MGFNSLDGNLRFLSEGTLTPELSAQLGLFPSLLVIATGWVWGWPEVLLDFGGEGLLRSFGGGWGVFGGGLVTTWGAGLGTEKSANKKF